MTQMVVSGRGGLRFVSITNSLKSYIWSPDSDYKSTGLKSSLSSGGIIFPSPNLMVQYIKFPNS